MKDFELRIIGNDKGELKYILLDYKTKTKTIYDFNEIPTDNIANVGGMSKWVFDKFKKVFRETNKTL